MSDPRQIQRQIDELEQQLRALQKHLSNLPIRLALGTSNLPAANTRYVVLTTVDDSYKWVVTYPRFSS